jgi:hypothetical protein
MQTCTMFSAFTAWFSRELEINDPGLSGATKPKSMSNQQWSRIQHEKTQTFTRATNIGITTPQLGKNGDKSDQVRA